jgi:hypothetical protein
MGHHFIGDFSRDIASKDSYPFYLQANPNSFRIRFKSKGVNPVWDELDIGSVTGVVADRVDNGSDVR